METSLNNDILAILLAGGAGERLSPLTAHTAKPAIPFGGAYRSIDFTLSKCVNSNIRRMFVLTQYKALELSRHIREGWNMFSGEMNEFIEVIPPMKRVHEDWYRGTADAVYQNLESILSEDTGLTLILAADHIYKMDYREMISWHRQKGADITLATIQVPPEEARRFGVVRMETSGSVSGFEEKPRHNHPTPSIFNPRMISASMGVYVFNTSTLIRALLRDAREPNSSHDFGRDILPACIGESKVFAYDFHDLNHNTVRYWRDVGALDAYYDANLDLLSPLPDFNLYDRNWPVRTHMPQQPPAKFIFSAEDRRVGVAIDSIVSAGCVIRGGRLTRSILSPGVRIQSSCEIDSSIIMNDCEIGRNSRIRRAILPPNSVIPENTTIGYNQDEDSARGYTITEAGVVVVPPPQSSLSRYEEAGETAGLIRAARHRHATAKSAASR
ncbi:MAG TPA: glucose-1-phosphate adenylyltransferase [Bryobacteraceae bacterium]|nr:glucose-1-phosphate adenylyltransferase [Bryobacteraceae bacterium]